MSSGRRVQTAPSFRRKAKKLSKSEKKILDEEVRIIWKDPEVGQLKLGDLQGVRVHKFRMNKQQVLLGYEVFEDEILLLTFGSHENYYRDLKNYRK
jgi:mRNA interferase RelE/StbE